MAKSESKHHYVYLAIVAIVAVIAVVVLVLSLRSPSSTVTTELPLAIELVDEQGNVVGAAYSGGLTGASDDDYNKCMERCACNADGTCSLDKIKKCYPLCKGKKVTYTYSPYSGS